MHLFSWDGFLVLIDGLLHLWAALLIGFATWYVWTLKDERYDGLF